MKSIYWETNRALLQDNPALDLNDPSWVIHTREGRDWIKEE
jgi:ADP-glucose pyrophosphorylase